MEDKKLKPVFFIKPYSPTIEKLLSAVQDIAEGESIKIHECEDIASANRILAISGPALILTSNAKPILKLLMARKKAKRNNSNKSLLINKKRFAYKVTKKFEKAGLTEQILEPINPKTVMHKIKLLVRSLKTLEDLEEKEERLKKLAADKQSANDDPNEIKSREGLNSTDDGEGSGLSSASRANRKPFEIHKVGNEFGQSKTDTARSFLENFKERKVQDGLVQNFDDEESLDQTELKAPELKSRASIGEEQDDEKQLLSEEEDLAEEDNLIGQKEATEEELEPTASGAGIKHLSPQNDQEEDPVAAPPLTKGERANPLNEDETDEIDPVEAEETEEDDELEDFETELVEDDAKTINKAKKQALNEDNTEEGKKAKGQAEVYEDLKNTKSRYREEEDSGPLKGKVRKNEELSDHIKTDREKDEVEQEEELEDFTSDSPEAKEQETAIKKKPQEEPKTEEEQKQAKLVEELIDENIKKETEDFLDEYEEKGEIKDNIGDEEEKRPEFNDNSGEKEEPSGEINNKLKELDGGAKAGVKPKEVEDNWEDEEEKREREEEEKEKLAQLKKVQQIAITALEDQEPEEEDEEQGEEQQAKASNESDYEEEAIDDLLDGEQAGKADEIDKYLRGKSNSDEEEEEEESKKPTYGQKKEEVDKEEKNKEDDVLKNEEDFDSDPAEKAGEREEKLDIDTEKAELADGQKDDEKVQSEETIGKEEKEKSGEAESMDLGGPLKGKVEAQAEEEEFEKEKNLAQQEEKDTGPLKGEIAQAEEEETKEKEKNGHIEEAKGPMDGDVEGQEEEIDKFLRNKTEGDQEEEIERNNKSNFQEDKDTGPLSGKIGPQAKEREAEAVEREAIEKEKKEAPEREMRETEKKELEEREMREDEKKEAPEREFREDEEKAAKEKETKEKEEKPAKEKEVAEKEELESFKNETPEELEEKKKSEKPSEQAVEQEEKSKPTEQESGSIAAKKIAEEEFAEKEEVKQEQEETEKEADLLEFAKEDKPEDEAEEEVFEGPDIPANLNGLDVAIDALHFYRAENKNTIIDKQLASLWEREKAVSTFFIKDKDRFIALKSAHEEESLNDGHKDIKSNWQQYQSENLSRFLETKRPTWSDDTFQAKEQEFIFPFFDGERHLGFVVTQLKGDVSPTRAINIEVLIETCRGFYLEKFKKTEKKAVKVEKPKEKGIKGKFKSFWKKLAS